MSGLARFEPHWQGAVAEYVSAITWAPNGQTIAISDAAGTIRLLNFATLQFIILQPAQGQSVDCLAFSYDSQFLAAAGQDGTVRIWQIQPEPTLLTTLKKGTHWIDRIVWHPYKHQLAFGFGFYAQVWDVAAGTVLETFNLASSAQDIQWHPAGIYLTISANKQIRTWQTADWIEQVSLTMASPATSIAWSSDGKFLASGNLDRTLRVWEWGNPAPWQMRGFPGKVRQLAWAQKNTTDPPLLATTSVEGIVTWEKDQDEAVGWNSQVLELHQDRIEAIAFQPQTRLLASASKDGLVGLWTDAKQIEQTLIGSSAGLSCLVWHPAGDYLAVGGQSGSCLIWAQT